MTSLLPPGRSRTARESGSAASAEAGGQSRRGLYAFLAGLGILAGAYVASRRIRSSDTALSADAVRERADEVLPVDGSDLPVVGSTGESAADEPDADDEELPGEDRSPEELEERAEENIQEEPAEPGEMNVDEDVAEEVIDEPAEEDEEDDTS